MLNVVNSVIRQQGFNSLSLLHKEHTASWNPQEIGPISVNDPTYPDYSDVRRWKCAIYRLGVVL